MLSREVAVFVESKVVCIFAGKLAEEVAVQGRRAWDDFRSNRDREAAAAHFLGVVAGADDVENPLATLRHALGFFYRGARALRNRPPLE